MSITKKTWQITNLNRILDNIEIQAVPIGYSGDGFTHVELYHREWEFLLSEVREMLKTVTQTVNFDGPRRI